MRWIIPLFISIFFCFTPQVHSESIVNSKHNLSSTGPNTIRALDESEICIFCHTPHAASDVGVLWNRDDSEAIYNTYYSSTTYAAIGQPTGESRLCLSCHDGTVALGALYNSDTEILFEGGIRYLDPAHGSLETSLTDDHPISFLYDDALAVENQELVEPSTIPDDFIVDRNGELQCTACHDPHDEGAGSFLRYSPAFGELCTLCHQKDGWELCSHSISSANVPGGIGGLDPGAPPATVAERACLACHDPHGAPAPERLRRDWREEEVCLPCHDGTVAQYDIEAELSKLSTHSVADTSRIHDPLEIPSGRGIHVECEDCHNPHAVTANSAPSSTVSGPLDYVRGIDLGGNTIYPSQYEYQICMKCHGENPVHQDRIPRLIQDEGILRDIQLSNPSFHPIAGPGRNPNVPSLIPPWDESSTVTCTDCHNNNDAAGGSRPLGPHGSAYEPILERNYSTQDFQEESFEAYAMCYKCHDYDSIRDDESFEEHDKHIRGEDVPCSACHDPHGVSATAGGTEENNHHLINFDLSIVSPNRDDLLYFEDLGTFHGQCFLKCHGKEHDPYDY